MSQSSRVSLQQNFSIEDTRSRTSSRVEAVEQLLRSQICLRRLAISFNVFFWITGPGLLGLGIWFYMVLSEYEPVVQRADFVGPAYLIIVAGGAAILAGIVGCLGGVNEHRHLLLLYSILVFIVCALEISACVYTFTKYDKTMSTVRASLGKAVDSYGKAEESRAALDKVQRKFSCCGLDSPSDWTAVTPTALPASTSNRVATFDLPFSCCPYSLVGGTKCSSADTNSFQQGCLLDSVDWIRWVLMVSGWASFAAACTQVLGLAIVCCFTRAVEFIYR